MFPRNVAIYYQVHTASQPTALETCQLMQEGSSVVSVAKWRHNTEHIHCYLTVRSGCWMLFWEINWNSDGNHSASRTSRPIKWNEMRAPCSCSELVFWRFRTFGSILLLFSSFVFFSSTEGCTTWADLNLIFTTLGSATTFTGEGPLEVTVVIQVAARHCAPATIHSCNNTRRINWKGDLMIYFRAP
jgi:hypothetical protein